MVKFQPGQSCKEKCSSQGGIPRRPRAPKNVPNHVNPLFFELFPCWNFTNAKTWFLKGVPIDFAQKSRVVFFLQFFKVFRLWKIKKNTSRAQKILNFFLGIDYIYNSVCTKNLNFLPYNEYFMAHYDSSDMLMFPPAKWEFGRYAL